MLEKGRTLTLIMQLILVSVEFKLLAIVYWYIRRRQPNDSGLAWMHNHLPWNLKKDCCDEKFSAKIVKHHSQIWARYGVPVVSCIRKGAWWVEGWRCYNRTATYWNLDNCNRFKKLVYCWTDAYYTIDFGCRGICITWMCLLVDP